MFNSRDHLKTCLDSILQAIHNYGNAELIVVDNGSTDGSYEMLRADYGGVATIYQLPSVTIAAVRNYGARMARAEYLSFIDSDCVVPIDYFDRAMAVFASIPTDATGCGVAVPDSSPWIEATWHDLHLRAADAYVDYLNSANFIIRKEPFQKALGFNESLATGEDAELGQKLRAAGFKIYESHSLPVIHLRGRRSLSQFFRKEIWHGLGMFGTFSFSSIDKPVAMTLAHLLLTLLGIGNLFLSPFGSSGRLGILALSSTLVPLATVIYRYLRRRSIVAPLRCLLLYHLYYDARCVALFKLLWGRILPSA